MTVRKSSPRPHTVKGALSYRNSTRSISLIDWLAGDRAHLTELILLANEASPDRQNLLNVLADPHAKKQSLTTVLARAKVAPNTFFLLLNEARLCEARAITTRQIAEAMPILVEDAMEKGAPHQRICLDCHGKKTCQSLVPSKEPGEEGRLIVATNPCTGCGGTGLVRTEATSDDRRTALEVSGLLKKGGGITITQTQQTGIALPPPDSLADLIAATDRVLQPLRTLSVIEAAPEDPHGG